MENVAYIIIDVCSVIILIHFQNENIFEASDRDGKT